MNTAPRWRPTRIAAQLAILAVSMFGVAAVFGAFFSGGGYLIPLGTAVVLATVVAATASAHIRRVDAVLLASLAGWAAFAPFALFPSRLGDGFPGSVFSAFGGGLADGWARMLTAGLPAEPAGELLIIPTLLLWVATSVAVVLVARTDAVLAPLVPPLAALVAVLLLVAHRGRVQLWLTGGILLGWLLLALVRASPPATGRRIPSARLPSGRRFPPIPLSGRLAFGIPVVGALAALGAAGAAVLPVADGSDRFDPRDHWHPPIEVIPALNPLVDVKNQLRADSATTLFTVRLASATGRVTVSRVRTAALGDFDGASWTDAGTFMATGQTLPDSPDPEPLRGAVVDAEISLDRLGGVYLPSLGRPLNITGMSVAFAPDSGVLARTASPRPGERYQLRAVLPPDLAEAGDAERAAVRPASGKSAGRYLELPEHLPPGLAGIVGGLAEKAATPYGRLIEIEQFLRDEKMFPYDLSARPGHSSGSVWRMVRPDTEEFRRGYAEQHAAAFALFARIMGFPSRVAVGYLVDERSRVGPDTYRVTSRHAHAWPEVDVAGLGWVAFEPTDTSQLRRELPPEGPSPGGPGTSVLPPTPPVVEPVVAVVEPTLDSEEERERGGEGGWVKRAAFWFGVVSAAAIAAVLLSTAGEKARRRWWRRHARTPAARIGGAWREARDRLSERGLSRSHSLTMQDVAGRVGGLPGMDAGRVPERVGELASIVDTALFAAAEPGEAAARRAWELTRLLRRELNRAGGLRTRARTLFDPRPLLPGGLGR